MRATNYNHCKVYLISLVLIVGVNILGVKCDIKTDFPKSGHIYSMVVLCEVLCEVQKSQLLWQLTTVDGLECHGR